MISQYLSESKQIINLLDINEIDKIIKILNNLRTNHGRLFILGIDGSVSNSSHAVNDFRKLTKIESYSATDNITELTTRINDDGWDFAYEHYLIDSNFNKNNALFILSVGGRNIKINATAIMSAQQAILASMGGAEYVSLFGGRINNMRYNTIEEIKKLRKILDLQKIKTKIITGSVRESLNVIEWLKADANIITVPPDFIKTMLIHPYTKETIKMFLDDGEKL